MNEKLDKSKMGNHSKHVPKDAQVIISMMKDLNISDYEPRVINQLLEFTYRYVTSVLEDARVFANHGKKKLIDLDDVRLAVQSQVDKSFTTPPPRQVLLEIAKSKNITPLPPIKPHCGLRLPPDRYCLSACNYRLKPTTKKQPSKILGGAKAGQKTVNQQNVIVKRQTIMTVPKTQSVQVMPKPVFKFNTGNKVVAKPAIKISQGAPGGHVSQVKMEVDIDSLASKRKREDDDYDV